MTLLLTVITGNAMYVVKSGDTLSTIADENGTTVQALVEANDIGNPNLIRIGDELVIPGADTYVVQPGDTLAGISARFGVPIQQIRVANGITDTNLIYAGAQLRLEGPDATVDVSQPTNYTVRAGDTLAKIASHFSTSIDRLVQENSITNPDLIRVGAVLMVDQGSWLCPVPNATFVNDWGFPRSGGRFHSGNDLFAPRGSPVYAPVDGVAAQVVGSLGGNQVNFTGNDGTLYILSHLDAFAASGHVSAGDLIGYVGNTGNAAGGPTHVHFEIHPDGQDAVNPFPFVSAACK
jgi:murein DD-endopeptidase MepM/ murein hydrolase activator NlpD